ncbi:hypothetical protein KH389_18995 [Pseudomonas qingdaonensis]|uniref:Transposase n=1 Tax=Pseudomonas qingdaonensis TaxID=2056231 RepID=A0ABX8DN43_9PSED|nr:hypothetical protein [Pseudomonas qingdaonensis]QVL17474.1 hypothetical protein KH389_18995 [Pseudomonas qingdaonensis]
MLKLENHRPHFKHARKSVHIDAFFLAALVCVNHRMALLKYGPPTKPTINYKAQT